MKAGLRQKALHSGQRSRGVGALAVVMVILFIMMLVAAYANRSLMIEQRISGNHYRTAVAFEAAEAGLEWGVSQLNSGRVDNLCQPSTSPAFQTFVRRAVGAPDNETGTYPTPPTDPDSFMRPVCTRSGPGSGWACYCATTGRPPLSTLAADAVADSPLFVLSFSSARIAGGLVNDRYSRVLLVESRGCNRLVTFPESRWDCTSSSESGRAFAQLSARAGLIPALVGLPTALLTARGSVDLSGGARLSRPPAGSSVGPVLLYGNAFNGGGTLTGAPGTPANALATPDSRFADTTALSPELFFTTFFGVPRAVYAGLPAVRVLDCTADCASSFAEEFARGRRLFLVTGDVSLADISLGTADDPVVLVADGDVTLGNGAHLSGFLFGRNLISPLTAATATLNGAAAFFGDVQIAGTPTLVYDQAVLSRLHLVTGTWVRVPGSWNGQ